MAITVPPPLSNAEKAKMAIQILRAAGEGQLAGTYSERASILPRGADLDEIAARAKGTETSLNEVVMSVKGREALARAPKTRPEGNIAQMWHPLRARMSELGNLSAINNAGIVDETINVLTGQPIEPIFGYRREIMPKGGPFPFIKGGFDPTLDFDSSFLLPVIADDEAATKQLYEAVRKKTAGMSTGKYPYTVDELRAVVDELKPIRHLLRYELMVGGVAPGVADRVTVNRAVRAAVFLSSLATIAKNSDLSSVGLNRRTFAGRIYEGPRGRPAAALDLFGGNLIVAATRARVPGHQRAVASYVFQNQLGPGAGFRAGRDALRQPGMPNLPVMPVTMQQAQAISKNVREIQLFESSPTVEKALKALGPEELLDRTEQAMKKRLGADRMKEIVNEMFAIAEDTGRDWTEKAQAGYLLQQARGAMTAEDFGKLTEEIAQVSLKPKRAAPGVTREVRAVRGAAINPNTLKKEVRKAASELGLRVRNPAIAVALAGVLLTGLLMARDERETA